MSYTVVEKTRRRKNLGGKTLTEVSESEKENRAPSAQHVRRHNGFPDALLTSFGARERPTARDHIPDSARIQRRDLDRGQENQNNNPSEGDKRRSRASQTQESGTGSDTEGEDRELEAIQLQKVRRQLSAIRPTGPTSSQGDTEPSWGLLREMRKKKTKGGSRHRDNTQRENREDFPRSVKTINQMISKFRKGGHVNILEHIILYERLMKTLGMTASEELIRYLPWTFEDKLQSFFLEIDSGNYPEWCQFRAEVIKNFSAHRNKHEALLHALAMKCQPNQNPREYFHELKKAFAQVYTVVDPESEEFRRTLFHGLPESTKAHMAGSYNDMRSSKWILEQARSIYDVSRTVDTDKNNRKPNQQEKKISEISTQKDQLPFESGKPNRQNGENYNQQKQDQKQKEPPQQGADNPRRRDPNDLGIGRELGVDYYVSPKYTGNRPIKDFKYRPRNQGSQSSGEDGRQGLQQGGRQSPSYPTQGGKTYPQGQQQQYPDASQGGQRYARYSERNDMRMEKVEKTLDYLARMMCSNQMAISAQQRSAAQETAEPQN